MPCTLHRFRMIFIALSIKLFVLTMPYSFVYHTIHHKSHDRFSVSSNYITIFTTIRRCILEHTF